ncbi:MULTISPECIES: MarR family winged helix-turn-helix transcriptional regulator [Methylosinus]|uniref:MarR family winged helix-turn-helix transcriptional regulator n=1 Tax=Methylosinus TaxID=425 RepID=UPI0001D2D522|nr:MULTISPECIES: MarR family transcriptional regulator [Methylosinus]
MNPADCDILEAPTAKAPKARPSEDELIALAKFRHALRRFLAFSEQAAADVGLTMQRYQALLVIKTYRGGDHISVGELAEQLIIRDHSAAELVSRLVQAKLVRRKTDPEDRRRSLVVITPSGDRRLTELAAAHLTKLRADRKAFLDLFDGREPTALRRDDLDATTFDAAAFDAAVFARRPTLASDT